MTTQQHNEGTRANSASLIRSEPLTNPTIRAIEISLAVVAAIGLIVPFFADTFNWSVLLIPVFLWNGLRPPRLSIGLDGIAHRSVFTTFYQPFESLGNADLERLGNSTCRIIIDSYQSKWSKPFGIDDAESTRLRDWLRAATQAAKEASELSRPLSRNLDSIAAADDTALIRLATGIGTNTRVRAIAIANLALRGSENLAEVHDVPNHILSRDSRRLVKRAFRIVSASDLDDLKRCLVLPRGS